MKRQIAAVLAPLLVAAPSTALAEQSFPYTCQWVSEVTPDAVIRFSSTNGVGVYIGELTYKGKRLMAFQEGQSQGYGTHWWNAGNEEGPSGKVVVFAGTQVVRGTPGLMDGKRPSGEQRVLLVGFGSALWYGMDSQWREDHQLITAGEGFWRSSPTCRRLF